MMPVGIIRPAASGRHAWVVRVFVRIRLKFCAVAAVLIRKQMISIAVPIRLAAAVRIARPALPAEHARMVYVSALKD